MRYVLGYLGTVIAANLVVTWFGPEASVFSALVMIGATLTLRDRLHDFWEHRGLVPKMGILIASSGVLSVLVTRAAVRIAVASFVAFVLSEAVDGFVYHLLRQRTWLARANGSNVVSALVDSVVFPTLAFGAFMPLIVLGQFLAKVGGGAIWSFILRQVRVVTVAGVLFLFSSAVDAQVLSLNGAWIKNDVIDAVAGEVFVASPSAFGVRPYAIVSWNTDAGAIPTVLLRVGHTRFWSKAALGVGAGWIRVPGDQFRPSFSVIGFGPSVGSVRPYALLAYEKPFGSWDTTTFVGISYTVKFWK